MNPLFKRNPIMYQKIETYEKELSKFPDKTAGISILAFADLVKDERELMSKELKARVVNCLNNYKNQSKKALNASGEFAELIDKVGNQLMGRGFVTTADYLTKVAEHLSVTDEQRYYEFFDQINLQDLRNHKYSKEDVYTFFAHFPRGSTFAQLKKFSEIANEIRSNPNFYSAEKKAMDEGLFDGLQRRQARP
jgi:hypothetical protein